MNETEQRIAGATKHFTWTGQPVHEWPSWMVFLNYATDGHSKIVIHMLDEILVVGVGDTVHRKADGQTSVTASNILQFPNSTPIMVATAPLPVAAERIEKTMSL